MRRLLLPALLAVTTLVAPLSAQDAGVPGNGSTGDGPTGSAAAEERKLEDTSKLTVRGEAELRKPADQLRLNIGVVTEGDEAASTLRENTDRMKAVVAAIEKIGLTDDEYKTGRFRIRPTYSRRPRQPAADWKPKITGYEVVNSIVVRTKQLDLAGKLIETANKAGANTVDVVAFELADPRTHRAEAIRDATKNAVADARTLAEAAGLDLVRIIIINLDHTPASSPEMTFINTRSRAMADSGAAPPLTPGDVTVRAGVTIVYEIAPRP